VKETLQDFRNINVWKKSHLLTKLIYQITSTFPKEEQFGLTSQIRRACVSIPSNIVEGCGREGNVEFCRFLQIAMGSLYELEYQILLARDLSFLEEEVFIQLNGDITEIRKMMVSLMQKLKLKE
jgi:four helix bundle protein